MPHHPKKGVYIIFLLVIQNNKRNGAVKITIIIKIKYLVSLEFIGLVFPRIVLNPDIRIITNKLSGPLITNKGML